MTINQLIQNASTDIIAVFDSNFNQVISNARPLRDEVIPRAKLMDHPLESGQVVTDYKITLPLEISIQFFVTANYYRDTYQQIWNLWQTSELLTVATRVGSFGNMIISEQPHEETPEKFDGITMQIRFRQVQTPAQAQGFAPANSTQADTQTVGQQTGTTTALPSNSSGTTGAAALNTQQNVQSNFSGASRSW